jgi:transposase
MLVHRGKNERYAAACTLPNPVYDRRTCMVWGCITASGRGPLAFVDGSIDSNKYISILQQHLIPFIDDMPLSRSMQTVFQQDNARPHSSHKTIEFLQQERVQTTIWPAYSPDLNPIENVWALMKREVRKSKPSTLDGLRNAIADAWEKVVTPSLCTRLFASMHSRMSTVICHHGLRM